MLEVNHPGWSLPNRSERGHDRRPAGSAKPLRQEIARWLAANQDRKPLLVSVTFIVPQLVSSEGHCEATGQSIFEQTETNDPLTLVRSALKHAQQTGFDTLLIDTAGRLHIDEELMDELANIKRETHPVEILFVADAMTGQDAVRSAEEFHRRIGITGVVLTKMDGAMLAEARRFRSNKSSGSR